MGVISGPDLLMSATGTLGPLSPELLYRMDAYWRAANYLSVGQIYLYDNPLPGWGGVGARLGWAAARASIRRGGAKDGV